MSDLSLYDIKKICDDLCPIEIKINDVTVYQDNDFDTGKEAFERYNEIFNWNFCVTEFNVEIVHFHHSIVSIYGEIDE